MKIEGAVIKERYLTVDDIDIGDVFKFVDSDKIYLKLELGYFADVETGNVCEVHNENMNLPVRKVNAVLKII